MADYLALKWGTLKSWKLETPESLEIMWQYLEQGTNLSAMAQRDTEEQKNLICRLIDVVDCETIYNSWSGEEMTKEQAKEYILNYGKD